LTARIQDPEEDIVLLKPDGTLVKRLTNDKFKDRNARWSPDGKRILFLSNRGGTFEYWQMGPDGSGLRRVAPSMALAWAPDGSLMGYPADRDPYCLDPPDSPCPLAAALPQGFLPQTWSPDGKMVAGRFRSMPPPREQLFVFSLTSRSPVEVSEHGFSPVWTKAGSVLLYWENNRIWSWDARSGRKTLVLDPGEAILQQRFTLMPDQQSLLFVLTETEEDIWLARKR
jgi:dipeptidyl aminopeptidase/acylaminoacyl peptidase